MTRASGAANGLQGGILGLSSAVTIQLIGRAFGPFSAWELVVYPLLGVAGGWVILCAHLGHTPTEKAHAWLLQTLHELEQRPAQAQLFRVEISSDQGSDPSA